MSFVLLGILNSQAAGAGAFDPASLNPDLWLDASDASTITESGGSVSQWNNKGTLSNFVQATSADQPTTGVTTQNGLNVINFDADFLEHAGVIGDYTFLHDGTTYFFALAYKYDASPGNFNSVFGTIPDGSDSLNGLVYTADNRVDNDYRVTVSSTTAGGRIVQIVDTNFLSSSFEIVSSIVDPDATAANRIGYFKNNTQGTEVNSLSGSASGSNPSNKLKVGSDGPNIENFTGNIGELIIVSGANATEENRQLVVDYLNAKWGAF